MSTAHPDGYESNVIPVATTSTSAWVGAVLKRYRASGPDGLAAHVTAYLKGSGRSASTSAGIWSTPAC